jgi:hypothetical protein
VYAGGRVSPELDFDLDDLKDRKAGSATMKKLAEKLRG